MNKPYIICHMMTAIDGRIDCGMTEKLAGVKEYYETLHALNAPTCLSGRVTAQLEMAKEGTFSCENSEILGQEGFSKKADTDAYSIVTDTKGTLLWTDQADKETPLIILTSEQVTKEYLTYLDNKHISWIACGKEKIDLGRAMEILSQKFGVERMTVVGGGTINGAFLAEGLLDEVSILLAPGIDGRKGMAGAFDGLPMETEPFSLTLKDVKAYEDGAVWLQYLVK